MVRRKTSSLVSTVLATIRRESLLSSRSVVFVACSGGPDSIALLHVLVKNQKRLGIKVCVGSIDHGLRPEARAEVEHVARLAQRWRVPFGMAKLSLRPGASLQARARKARYAALDALAEHMGATHKATAHTLSDQAETVIQRIFRGSGLIGVSAMAYARGDGWIRPLLDVSRSQVEDYIRQHKLSVVSDPSNEDSAYQRVRIRKHLIPHMRAEQPRIESHLAWLARECQQVNAALGFAAQTLIQTHGLSTRVTCDTTTLAACPTLIRSHVIRTWVEQKTGQKLNRAQVIALLQALEARQVSAVEIWLKSRWTVSVRSGTIELSHGLRRRRLRKRDYK